MNETLTLDQFVKSLSQASTRLRNNARSALYEQSNSIIQDLMRRSPVDEDVFRQNWKLDRKSFPNTIASATIINRTPYGGHLDVGVTPGAAPWYWPKGKGEKVSGATSRSGKLIIRNGRVWAGGKSPSGFVVGGISDVVLMDNWKRQFALAKALADASIGAI